MKTKICWLAIPLVTALVASAQPAVERPSISVASGWTLLKEGDGEGVIDEKSPLPGNPGAAALKIAVTKTTTQGKGRTGAANATLIPVENDQWYDFSFSAMTQAGSIGLVFSLETAEGKVLARTTLPEIGRGRAGGAPAMQKYSVSLHARAADAKAHLVIWPIEPTTIWLDGISVTQRKTEPATRP